MDDLEIEDLFKERKKKINSGRKGKRTELSVSKILSKRFGQSFTRSVGSGNRWAQVSCLPKHANDVYSGDIVCPENFRFTIESKGGYDDIDLSNIFTHGNSVLDGFLKQAIDEGERCDRSPLVLWKKNRRPWLAFIKTKDLIGEWTYRLVYKEWSAVDLNELLKLEDKFWFK